MATQLLIGGSWRPASGGEFEAVDPATEQVMEQVGYASTSDVEEAVAAARAAFEDPAWRDLLPPARAGLLFALADAVEAEFDELARLETLDQGQPLPIAKAVSLTNVVNHLRYYAGWVTKIEGRTAPVSFPDTLHYTRREPVGVCALITPWNFPLMILVWKLAPALATGNTVVIKPPEQASLTSIRLVQLAQRVGFPPGVVNLVTGDGAVGAALAEHPGVDKVSFTGSTEVGRSIVRAAAGNLKRVTLELGGKAPSIIARDADVDAALAGNLGGGLLNSGQVCAAYTRFFVDSAREDEFVTKMAAAVQGMRIGPGIEEGTDMGPLVSAEHLGRVQDLVAAARQEGAQLVTGGQRARDTGYFLQPTVFAGVTDEMRIASEEVFGPVLSVLRYEDEDELHHLIARANDTPYGLAASIWTRDLTAAHKLANGIRAGAIWVNMPNIPDAAAPWGGFKASGWGREMGPYALDAYTEVKGIWMHYGT